jgi:hypothetical protein
VLRVTRSPGVGNAREQFSNADPQPLGNPDKGAELQVVDTALDSGDVRPVKVRSLGKFFLRKVLASPQGTNPPAEGAPNVVHEPASWMVPLDLNIERVLY